MIQSRSVVGSVSGYGYDCSFLLKQLYQTLLVSRAGAAHDLQVEHAIQQLLEASAYAHQFWSGNGSSNDDDGAGTVRTVSVDAVNTGLPEAVRLTIRAVRDNYSYLLKK